MRKETPEPTCAGRTWLSLSSLLIGERKRWRTLACCPHRPVCSGWWPRARFPPEVAMGFDCVIDMRQIIFSIDEYYTKSCSLPHDCVVCGIYLAALWFRQILYFRAFLTRLRMFVGCPELSAVNTRCRIFAHQIVPMAILGSVLIIASHL